MDVPEGRARTSVAEATLSAFEPPVRDLLVPLLLYKTLFLGDWFSALARQERDEAVRASLLKMSRETLGETIEIVDTMRPWSTLLRNPEALAAVVETVQRRILQDLLVMKEGNAEAVLFAAMRAPTDELRRKLVRLADRDRAHADDLRRLLGARTLPQEGPAAASDDPLGAREARAGEGTLGASIRRDLARLHASGGRVVRIVLSPAALRHLRDEALVQPDGTAFGVPLDVDFAWGGECHSFITDERVRLAEMLTREL